MSDAVEKLREAWQELKQAKDSARRVQTYRRGSYGAIGYGSRKQAANVSDATDYTVAHIEKAMKLIEESAAEVKKCLQPESKLRR